ncbi:RibD family protein [Algihabitans albus]|uniref:RibD family protein n=1 Tax=Algihabitans albus TaxID=2164067 RepID=UPI001F1F8916|nr:RibD family protein [Algihabitans albus]
MTADGMTSAAPDIRIWDEVLTLAAGAASAGQLERGPSGDWPLWPLYRPLLKPVWTLAHLGQTLDGRIATEGGASRYVTGPENLDHLHRLRALADAVIVGGATAALDDPRLTTRRVKGTNPVRVVLDPKRRLPSSLAIFLDGAAPTLLVAAEAAGPHGQAEVIAAPLTADGRLSPQGVVAALRARGLKRLFVEGGGVTVSRWLVAGALDALQVTVAPMILGSGRPSLTLPPIEDLGLALRPACRTYALGVDVLFDFTLGDGSGRLNRSR